ncbi:hypothetical protein [uncultured Nonlabens sp.]|uniref:hypothetical protein n=1 Tax=uncultured Nonlabens sp. TaxID=859306 RepID=UPI00262E9D18|nr:hypothetical protein [uncultured Nonlabens sp.]
MKQFKKSEFETKAYENIDKLSNLNTNSYIKLGSTSVNSHVGDKFIKVDKINNDSILFKKISIDKFYKNNDDIGTYYKTNRSILDSFWLSQKKLKNAICTNYDNFINNENSLGVALFNSSTKYLIDDIIDIDNKILLKYIEDSRRSKTEVSIVLKNYGLPCNIVKIENLLEGNSDNDIKWLNELPQFLKTTDDVGEKFYLKGANEPYLDYAYDFIIHLKSLNGEIHKFHIKREYINPILAPDIEKVK